MLSLLVQTIPTLVEVGCGEWMGWKGYRRWGDVMVLQMGIYVQNLSGIFHPGEFCSAGFSGIDKFLA